MVAISSTLKASKGGRGSDRELWQGGRLRDTWRLYGDGRRLEATCSKHPNKTTKQQHINK